MMPFARQLRDAERRAQSPFCFRGPLGGGSFGGGGAKAPVVPISDAYWSTGGWWDLYNISGANNAQYALATPGQSAGALGNFTPASETATKPVIYDAAIGGRRGLILDSTQPNYLRNDALINIINGTNKQWLIVFDFQPNAVGVALHDNTVLSWGSDNSGAHSPKLNIQFNGLGGGTETQQSVTLIQSTGDLVTTENDLSQVVGYDYFRFQASYDGTTLKTYINGAPSAVVPTTWQAAAMLITRMIWGAWAVNGIGFLGANGYVRRAGFRALPAASDAEVARIDANMVANDYTLPQSSPRVPVILSAGASVQNGSHDEVTGMGVRYFVAKYIQDNKRSWTTVGAPQGQYALRNTSAQGGASDAGIAAQVAGAVTARTKLVLLELGYLGIGLGNDAATVEASIVANLHNARASIYAVAPQCQVLVQNITPYSEAGFNAVVASVNAALPGIWAASNAEFPAARPLLTVDYNAAIGGPAYVQANYNAAGDDHPNHTGYTLMGAALLAVIGPFLNSISPT